MTSVNHKDVWIRAGKTALQAFVGVFVVAFANLFDVYQRGGLSALHSALVAVSGSALAALLSALWNYYLQYRSSQS